MSFRVTARTVLQLGAELISSDSVAFFELIKNAFDAGSPLVYIDVCTRMDHAAYLAHSDAVKKAERELTPTLDHLKGCILNDVDSAAPGADELIKEISAAHSFPILSQCLDAANYIQIADRGHGMSAEDLDKVFLTIGTPHRRRQKSRRVPRDGPGSPEGDTTPPILGEKGIGRLSAMRLGWVLDVSTTIQGEKRLNQLRIDWRQFIDDGLLLEDVSVSPSLGGVKPDPNHAGTRIRIYALASPWSPKKLTEIARDEFRKLTDPFVPDSRFPINLRYNNHPVAIGRFDDMLFSFAHASAEADYTLGEKGPRFVGTVRYKTHNRERSFLLDRTQLHSIAGRSSADHLESLGPFSVRLYWYNRRILSAIEGIGDQRAVRNLVDAWSGGLKVYRDGFRVNPYGGPDDDWLDIDKRALASSGYKVNRHQIIGVVAISSLSNPRLVDQTNREGLRDCPEKHTLVSLLQHLIDSEFRNFLNAVDREVKAEIPASFEDLEGRVANQERSIRRNLNILMERHPEVTKDRELLEPIDAAINQIRQLMNEASRLAASYEAGHSQLTNLAGIGLMIEIVAHELNRATSHALTTIADAGKRDLDNQLAGFLQTLGAQMQTLQRRLRILDPLSSAGRQRKEQFDLATWVSFILEAHAAQFARHNVQLVFRVVPDSSRSGMRVFMVKGMFVQILENLLSNSMYWIKIASRISPSFTPRIQVTLDKNKSVLSFSDNGPGIPVERREQVFQPFFTTKPPGEGHGLGLYVSREIAHYNAARLTLTDNETIHEGKLNTFRLDLRFD